MRKYLYPIFIPIFIFSATFSNISANATSQEKSGFVYIQKLDKGYIGHAGKEANENNRGQMEVVARIDKDNTVSFTSSKEVNLAGKISVNKFVQTINQEAQGKEFKVALVVNPAQKSPEYYILSIDKANYNTELQQITYYVKILEAVNVKKLNNGSKVSFASAVLFINGVCLECVLN